MCVGSIAYVLLLDSCLKTREFDKIMLTKYGKNMKKKYAKFIAVQKKMQNIILMCNNDKIIIVKFKLLKKQITL
jgi:hypothetical protein